VRRDGSRFTAKVIITPRRNREGEPVGFLLISKDITDDLRLTKELEETRELVETILEASTEYSIIGKGLDGTILLWNEGAKRLYGYEPEELIGKVNSEVLHTPEDLAAGLPQAMRQAALADGKWEGTITRVRRDGSRFTAKVIITPRRNRDGEPIGFLLISKDITEDLRLEKAEQANQAKSEYLSRMSHELRTPLNAILGFAQLLELDELSEDQRKGVGYILVGGRHLLGLIDELLDIAAIEAGRLPLSLEPVAVADLIAEAVSLIRPLAAQHGILLVDQPATCHDHVLGDRQGLKQILLNLLSNAVKYNREGGRVELACEVAGERLQVKVIDTGAGIAPEAFERLFVPFDRLGSERTSIEGTGLGLPLTKGLAEAMGGTLGVASTPGQGSSFWVELPRTQSPTERGEPPPEQDPGRDQPALTVLYIEDNLSNLQLVEHILRHRPGVKLISAMRPQLGLDLAAQHQPDLILLDLGLPDMPGEEVLRRLRAGSKTADLPVVVLSSADTSPSLCTRLLELGVRTFLTKPLEVKNLFALVDTMAAERAQAAS
ncbi:MAG TPA: ATP-binding protein, partial [Propionibacteriaceae bacterium]|nr:ATP-binding protein [Propionibacteriaceae bacterium]